VIFTNFSISATGYHLKITIRSDANIRAIEDFVQRYITTSDTLQSNSKRMKRAMSLKDLDAGSTGPLPGTVPGFSSHAVLTLNSRDQDQSSIYFDASDETRPDPYDLVIASYEKEDSLFHRQSKAFIDRNMLRIQLPSAEGSEFSKLFQALEEDGDLARFGIISWSVCLYDMADAFYE